MREQTPTEAWHTKDCDSRFASVCGDFQRCSCGLDAYLAALSARCTALEQERDKQKTCDVCHKDLSAVPTVLINGTAFCMYCAGVTTEPCSRCQHLEQAVKDAIENLEGNGWQHLGPRAQHVANALASLLPSQDGTPRMDENRVSFAAGYSTALDDVLKDRKL